MTLNQTTFFQATKTTMNNANNNTISRQLQVDEQNISYELGVYKTDYYYRAEIYQKDKICKYTLDKRILSYRANP